MPHALCRYLALRAEIPLSRSPGYFAKATQRLSLRLRMRRQWRGRRFWQVSICGLAIGGLCHVPMAPPGLSAGDITDTLHCPGVVAVDGVEAMPPTGPVWRTFSAFVWRRGASGWFSSALPASKG